MSFLFRLKKATRAHAHCVLMMEAGLFRAQISKVDKCCDQNYLRNDIRAYSENIKRDIS